MKKMFDKITNTAALLCALFHPYVLAPNGSSSPFGYLALVMFICCLPFGIRFRLEANADIQRWQKSAFKIFTSTMGVQWISFISLTSLGLIYDIPYKQFAISWLGSLVIIFSGVMIGFLLPDVYKSARRYLSDWKCVVGREKLPGLSLFRWKFESSLAMSK